MLLFLHQRSKLSPWNRKLYLFSSHRDAKRRAAHGGGHGERRRGRDWGFVLDWGLGRGEEERERSQMEERWMPVESWPCDRGNVRGYMYTLPSEQPYRSRPSLDLRMDGWYAGTQNEIVHAQARIF